MEGITADWQDSRFMNLFVVADLVNQPIHIITPDGIVQFVNQAWCGVYKTKPEDAVGRHIEDAIKIENFYISVKDKIESDPSHLTFEHFNDPTRRSAAIQALEQRERVSMLAQTPTFSQVMVTATPIFNDRQEIICVFTLIQDLTMLARWHDYMEQEMQKNRLIQQELQHLRVNHANSRLTGNSRAIVELRKLISVVAASDANVLLIGESGVGKELVAKEIYSESLRKDKPFIDVNCAAIPENLLESELFGHEKGAFTGATNTKLGLFELADGGTILLDEIGEFPLALQPKLLRVLQEREFRRVGGTKKISVDVRVIAATNRDLFAMTKTQEFRMDLYYRLNVFTVQIPPLQERKEDIPFLACAFLDQFNQKYHKAKFFTKQAFFALEQYPWTGNVRELENAVERSVVIGDKAAITEEHVCAIMGSGSASPESGVESLTLKEAVENLERRLISDALHTYKTTYKAAEALGSTQSTIARKAKLLNIKNW